MKKILHIVNQLILAPLIDTLMLLFIFAMGVLAVYEGKRGGWVVIIFIFVMFFIGQSLNNGYILQDRYPDVFKNKGREE